MKTQKNYVVKNKKGKGHKGKGDRSAQKRRRRNNNKHVEYQDNLYLMIDGNFTHVPVAYCSHYKGYVTQNMLMRHECDKRNCPRLKMLKDIQMAETHKHEKQGIIRVTVHKNKKATRKNSKTIAPLQQEHYDAVIKEFNDSGLSYTGTHDVSKFIWEKYPDEYDDIMAVYYALTEKTGA